MEKDYLRKIESYPYEDPRVAYNRIVPEAFQSFEKSRNGVSLRHLERKVLETYQGALMAYCMQYPVANLAQVEIALIEDDDFDCIIRMRQGEAPFKYKLVQLKQIWFGAKNPSSEFRAILTKVREKKYGPDVVLGIWQNCDGPIALSRTDLEGLRIAELWVFGTVEFGTSAIEGGPLADLMEGWMIRGIIGPSGLTLGPVRVP